MPTEIFFRVAFYVVFFRFAFVMTMYTKKSKARREDKATRIKMHHEHDGIFADADLGSSSDLELVYRNMRDRYHFGCDRNQHSGRGKDAE